MKIVRKGMIAISLMIAIGFLSGCESKEDIYDQGYGDGADDALYDMKSKVDYDSESYSTGYNDGYDDAKKGIKKHIKYEQIKFSGHFWRQEFGA